MESHLGHKTSRVQDEYLEAKKRVKKELESLTEVIENDKQTIDLYKMKLNRLTNVDNAVKPMTELIK